MELNIHYLSGPDVQALALTNDEALALSREVWQRKVAANVSLNRACTSFPISLTPATLTFCAVTSVLSGSRALRLLEIFKQLSEGVAVRAAC